MARNQEKSSNALFRWRETQLVDMGLINPRGRVPGSSKSVARIGEAESFRMRCLDELSRKITKINDRMHRFLRVLTIYSNIDR